MGQTSQMVAVAEVYESDANASHMQADIAVQDFALTPQELKTIELMAM